MGDMSEWSMTSGSTCSVISSMPAGSVDGVPVTIKPPDDGNAYDTTRYMVRCSTGPGVGQIDTVLMNDVVLSDDVPSVPVSFEYQICSEEYPEWLDNIFDDSLTAFMVRPGDDADEPNVSSDPNLLLATNVSDELAYGTTNEDLFPGLDLGGDGDTTVGCTGWKTAHGTINLKSGAGIWKMLLHDEGDALYDTVVLIDRIRFSDSDLPTPPAP